MLSKHDSIQRDQLEMITLDQLVSEPWLRSPTFTFLTEQKESFISLSASRIRE
ncbi:hypothetical protein ABEY41_26300 [Peribacillus butanolivorans]|uniref:hypothetical protein n=1 Tax=Peribacillus butanolivorans TaxID=421767 RepID=UPI003D282DE0